MSNNNPLSYRAKMNEQTVLVVDNNDAGLLQVRTVRIIGYTGGKIRCPKWQYGEPVWVKAESVTK